MATSMDHSRSFFVMAINADGSNRVGKLHDTRQDEGSHLIDGLKELVQIASKQIGRNPSIVTISEMGRTLDMNYIMENLNEGLDNDEVKKGEIGWSYTSNRLHGKDGLVTMYDQSVFEVAKEVYNSDRGRYQGLKLTEKTSGLKILYFSVHLPKKQGKDRAYGLLNEAINEIGRDIDVVLVGGDWNIEPHTIIEKFKTEFHSPILALSKRDGHTSARGEKTIDNFAAFFPNPTTTKWRMNFGSKKIMRDEQYSETSRQGYTTHAPIWAEVVFEKKTKKETSKGESSSAEAKKTGKGESSSAEDKKTGKEERSSAEAKKTGKGESSSAEDKKTGKGARSSLANAPRGKREN